MLTHKESLFAGSFFPDWGYNCIGKLWNEAAEEAHWPPFAEAAVKYILETYPKPWTDHAKALIVFLFGTVSHSVGDLSWHALRGLDAGFIKTLAENSFAGDYSKGHTLADIGAEFVLSHMSSLNHLLTSWKVPVKDITEIYKRMGYFVPRLVLSHCMRNGFAGAQANVRLGSKLFPVYASKSPFLVEQVEDYPMGGLRDMAEWTIECWKGLAAYLAEERSLPQSADNSTSFNLCYALWEGRTRSSRADAMKRAREGFIQHQHAHPEKDWLHSGSALSRLRHAGLRILSESDEETGMVTFSVEEEKDEEQTVQEEMNTGAEVEDASARMKRQQRPQAKDEDRDNLLPGPLYSIMPQTRFARVGWTTTPVKRDPEPSPQNSSSASAKGPRVCMSFSDSLGSEARTLYLPVPYSSFGHAAVNGDFDGDGHMDLAIAAPHMTLDPLVPSQGSVFIVPSRTVFAQEIRHKEHQSSDGDADIGTDIRLIASRVLHGHPTEPQSRFGWALAVVDLNEDGVDDLAIGAPGHGAKDLKYDGSVFVYFGHVGIGLSKEPDLVIHHDRAKDDAQSNMAEGMKTLAGVGYVLAGLDLTGSGFKDLVIGMPMATATAINQQDDEEAPSTRHSQQAGKVLVFLAAARQSGQKLDTDRDWELTGEDAYGWFGASFTVVEANSQPEPEVRWSWGPRLPSIFSWSMALSPRRSIVHKARRRILVVGSPTFGVGKEEAMRGKLQGYLIPPVSTSFLSREIPVRSSVRLEKIFTIHGDKKFQQLGSRLASNRIISTTTAPSFSYTRSFVRGISKLSFLFHRTRHEDPQTQDLLVIGSQSEGILSRLPRLGRQWQAGVVRILDVGRLPRGTDAKISDLDLDPRIVRDSLRGSQSMAHLSAAMEASTDGKSLWLAEPYAKAEAGRIVEWEPSVERKDDGDESGPSRRQRRRRALERRKSDSSSAGSRRRLLRRDDGDDDDNGGDGDEDEDLEQIRQCFVGSDFKGRFGSQLLVADLNGDGTDDIVVTSSHSSQYAAMAGTVVVKLMSSRTS
ncbi:Glycosylphosphatidylinositol specific phospholipase D1 [Mortierella sp. GBA30]|nr:Glycosylphosphatidylinositol specific phospholipase D1 [Mortierella sp. GBA30]